MEGPGGSFEAAPWASEVMLTLAADLERRLADIPGASVEINRVCCSAHYRLCPGRKDDVAAAVAAAVAPYGDMLRVSSGRKVVEIKPAVAWDKGRALLFLLESLGLADSSGPAAEEASGADAAEAPAGEQHAAAAADEAAAVLAETALATSLQPQGGAQAEAAAPHPPNLARAASAPVPGSPLWRQGSASTPSLSAQLTPAGLPRAASTSSALRQRPRRSSQPTLCIYLGDDTSDEDAFAALRETGLGIGILVSSKPKPSAAHFSLRSPSEVCEFLRRVAALQALPEGDEGEEQQQQAAEGGCGASGALAAAFAAVGGRAEKALRAIAEAHAQMLALGGVKPRAAAMKRIASVPVWVDAAAEEEEEGGAKLPLAAGGGGAGALRRVASDAEAAVLASHMATATVPGAAAC